MNFISDEINGVSEDGESHSFFRQLFPGPARVVRVVEVGFRVGHETENPSRFVTDAGDGVHGAVGIGRIIHRCPVITRMAVLNGDCATAI